MTAESHREGAPERLDVPFELKSLETRRRDDGAEVGVFDGLASTFGNKDMAGDLIEPGAFAASLAGPGAIKMLWQHDARAPIGVWEKVAETAAGLEVRGRLVLEVQQARCVGLTPYALNNRPRDWLHGLRWIDESEIRGLPEAWNWLEGWSDPGITPKVVHFTRGTPNLPGYEDVPYAEEWRTVLAAVGARPGRLATADR